MKDRRPDPLDEHDTWNFHFGCAPTRALPSEAVSRCTRPVAGRAHPGAAYTSMFCGVGVQGHTRSERPETKKPGSLAGSGPLNSELRQARRSDAAASRIGAILGLAMVGLHPARTQREGAHERTQAGEGFGVAMGDPAVHDGVLVAFRFEVPRRAKVSGLHFVQKVIALSSDRTQCK